MERSSRSRPARRPGFQVGRVFGVPLYLNASILLLALLIIVLYGELAGQRLQLSPAGGYLVGAGFVVTLLGSVLAHELGHALTARHFGIGVRGITLELLGGYTEMDRDAPSPRVDLLVSLAGPAVSAVLGVAAVAAVLALPDRTVADQLAFQLAASNIIVALFNILPGLPLDGGRALRAVLWALTRDRHRATEVAGWTGRIVAVGTALAVVLLYAIDVLSLLALPLTALVALTLWHGAGQSIRLSRISRRLPWSTWPDWPARPWWCPPAPRWPRRSAGAPRRRRRRVIPSRCWWPIPPAGRWPWSTRPPRRPYRRNGAPGSPSTWSPAPSASCRGCRWRQAGNRCWRPYRPTRARSTS